jgi:hypothetical protein
VVDTNRVNDTFRLFNHAREAANKFASIAEDANAFHLPRTVESRRKEVPEGVGRPRGLVFMEPVRQGRGRRGERLALEKGRTKGRRDIRGNALGSRAEMLDEDATLAEGLLVNYLAVGQTLAEGLLDTGAMGARGAELDLFDDGDLLVER